MTEPVRASDVPAQGEKPFDRDPHLPLEPGYGRVDIRVLKPATRNPRRGNIAALVESLREFGQHRAVVVRVSDGEIIVGNHMYHAANRLAWDEIDYYGVEDDDEKALRRAIADNAVGDRASWDEVELGELLDEVGSVPGFTKTEVDRMLAKIEDTQHQPEQASFPIVPRMDEQYDYVVVIARNATDVAWLHTFFDLRKEQNYKGKPVVSMSHVVECERLQNLLEERDG